MMVLAKLITLGGLSMSLVNSTAPMSGYEHVMSHVLDMQAEAKGVTLAKHGSQVALATLLCSVAYQEFLDASSRCTGHGQLLPATGASADSHPGNV